MSSRELIPTPASGQHRELAHRFKVWSTTLIGFIFVYPLLLVPSATSEGSYNTPRLILLLLVGLVALVQEKTRATYRDPFILFLLAHVLLALLSTALHPDPDGSIFSLVGSEERGDALLYQLGLTLIGIFAYGTLRHRPAALRSLAVTFLVVGALESVVVMFQRFGYDVLVWLIGHPGRNFISGTIGHPGMVAGLLLPTLLVGLGLYFFGVRRHVWVLVLLFIVAIGIGVTANRSSYFALLAVLVLVVLQRRTLGTLALCALLAVSVYGAKNYLPIASGGTSGSYTNTTTLSTRLMIWQLALDAIPLIPGEPFIGGGADAFQLTLVRDVPIEKLAPLMRLELAWPDDHILTGIHPLYQPDQPLRSWSYLYTFEDTDGNPVEPQAHQVNLDRAHNFLLDRVLAYGVLDALIWLLLYGIAIWRGLRAQGALERGLAWALLAVGIYYLTWFPVIQVEPLHLIMVAALWATLRHRDGLQIAEEST